jgi:hypothetical protein
MQEAAWKSFLVDNILDLEAAENTAFNDPAEAQ